MTPSDVITSARRLLNDEQVPYRYSNDDLLSRINDCLSVLVDLRNDLFVVSAEHTCTAGAEQVCVVDRLRKVVEVPRIVGGAALWPSDRALFDMFSPGWYQDTAAPAVNWMRHLDDLKFYLHPPATAGQKVEVRVIQAAAPLTALDQPIPLPANYQPAIEAFVINRAESKDDEHVNTGRAAAFLSDFAGMVGVGAKA